MSEKKPEDYYLNKFIRKLIEKKAEVRVDGKTYQDGHNLNIHDLIGDLLGLDKDSVYKLVEKSTMLKENSSKNRTSNKQRKVLKEVGFYFDTHDYKKDPAREKHNKSDFFIKENGRFFDVYPQFSASVNDAIVGTAKQDLNILIKNALNPFYRHPFSKVIDKVRKTQMFDEGNVPESFHSNFQTIIERYKQNADSYHPGYLIPGYYNFVEIPYHECFKSILPEYTYKGIENTGFSNPETWFDQYRYQRLKLLEPKLLSKEVKNWPKWALEHYILAVYEQEIFIDEIIKKVKEEVSKNIQFYLKTSGDEHQVQLRKEIGSFHELVKAVSEYDFPGNFSRHINVDRGTLLGGSFPRHINYLLERNSNKIHEITYPLAVEISISFFQRIAESIGLGEENWSQVRGILEDPMYLKEESENINS